jgi:hypothetical protein
MITERDRRIIEFVQEFRAVYIEHVRRRFFANYRQGKRLASRALLKLWKVGEVRRTQDQYTRRLVYYSGSKSQLRHKLLVTEFYSRLPGLVHFEREKAIGNVQADAYAICRRGGREYHYLLEVQISHQPVDTEKYERLARNRLWPGKVFPRVIVISDRRLKIDSPIQFLRVGTDFKEWKEVIT